MGSVSEMCFDCLQRRIEADFSGRLTFIHGLSDSTVPFGSRAVVQVPDSGEVTPQQFVLDYVPYSKYACLGRYVDDYCEPEGGDACTMEKPTSPSCVEQDQAEVSVGICNVRNTALDSPPTECRRFPGRLDFRIGCEKCRTSTRFSCSRTITSLAPTAQIGHASHELFDELASNFSSGLNEDQLLHSISHLMEGKSATRESINFLSLVGLPTFEDEGFPGCIRHPNICPVLGMLKSSCQIGLVFPKAPYTLENILRYSPGSIKSDWMMQLLLYQILSALSYMHGLGVAHGDLVPSNIMLSDTLWCWLQIGGKQLLKSKVDPSDGFREPSARGFCSECISSRELYADLSITESRNWKSSFYSWWKGELSNFEYLLILNRLAGRRWGDHTFYTVMPWVIDFTIKPDEDSNAGWRDLSKSKWHLAKGDEQLDFTYSTSEIPHHVSDECLSELAVCSYKARRLPLSVLRTAVRSVYEPNEYPSNMQRLYQWTPDECIPEFYCDPRIFYSLHPGMPDLAVPLWAGSPQEFIKLHKDALESNRVSRQIHHWIDLTFGYKMSGEAAIAAKNVMLPASTSTLPRSTGRFQLFTQPHPTRRIVARGARGKNRGQIKVNDIQGKDLVIDANSLSELEEATSFCENTWHLDPNYQIQSSESLKDDPHKNELLRDISENMLSTEPDSSRNYGPTSIIDSDYIIENIEVDDDSWGYQELLLWRKTSFSKINSKEAAEDIFAVGCILAELHLKKPLFGPSSFASYMESGVLPCSMQGLPHCMKVFIEACIQKEWDRRPSAKCLLESPYFMKSVKSSYLFLASFHLLAKDESRLQYAATFARRGALKAMGAFGIEICAPFCLQLVVASASDTEAEWAYVLLTEFLRYLKLGAVMKLVVPSVQRILQGTCHSHLKVSLLQGSFMQEIWNRIGKQAYLETIHPLIISNLCVTPPKSSSGAAAVLLIGSSEELGVPVTFHQTILPLMLSFGKGISNDGVDVLIRIGGLFGENFIVKQIISLLHKVIHSCICTSHVNKPEPMQSWGSLALMDCLTVLDGFVPTLTTDTIVKELIEEGNCLYVKILMHKDMGFLVLQNAAKGLIRVCQQIGPDSTALHVLPKLKELFYELAFTQKENSQSVYLIGSVVEPRANVREEDCCESRMDLVLLLYPQLASLLGIEKLRQCCATWLILEQLLLRHHNWKWEYAGDSNQNCPESINFRRHSYNKGSTSEDLPAKLLVNGVGWSRPQSQGKKGSKNLYPDKHIVTNNQSSIERYGTSSRLDMREPWYWFPSAVASLNELDFTGRASGPKDELPWKVRASVIQSFRAYHGALRSFAVCQNECTVFTAGVGPNFKGNIQKWELSRVDCVSCYNGHDEVVNDIFVLASSGRVASCDGTVHIWNGQTGRPISIFSENSLHSTQSKERDEDNMLHFNPLPTGMVSTAFHGNSYTTMDYLEFKDRLLVGTGNGSLRFIDVNRGQKLHLWRSESSGYSFPSLISSICSSSSIKERPEETGGPPSWIAAAFSNGYCRLFDMNSGKIIASWQAHDGYVTKLAAAGDHLLVSSSLDKTLRIWDLRRNWTAEHTVFRGYSDGVSGFSLWGQNVISICRNKIGLSSLRSSADEDENYRVSPQHLYMADGESKNTSVLSAISILPFSRLFLLGTEDGHLKICC
ncbi:protein serine/threonine kinase [Striga asiatica]|uniref:Protein serine/threonine kinase n=1 Tax=Striga asiatica TaxID=4170 RepID=A0A5A7PWE1_STRAF|nr:protein serine/threonine kinase [Striga asiatica]